MSLQAGTPTQTGAASRSVDPVTFEVVRGSLACLADEMAIAVVRTAHSQVVRDSMDFSTALFDASGRVVAQGLTLSLHLGSMPDALACVLARYADEVEEGDVFILNDPDEGGMHLPDIFLFRPVFFQSELIGFAGCVAHQADIGGRMPGGNAVDSTEIYQEGLQIPVMKFYSRGVVNQTLVDILQRNVRIPEIVMGDLRAQLAACHIAEVGLVDLAERYGREDLAILMDEVLAYSERRLREELGRIPDGTYEFEDAIDDDGMGSGRIPICAKVTVRGTGLEVDFAHTSPQVKGALNATASFAKAAAYTALACVVDSDIPRNDGFYRCVQVSVPEGSILNPRRPAPRAARGLTGERAVEVVSGALQKACPDRVPAPGDGGPTMLSIGGHHPDGRAFVYTDFIPGGWGARPTKDGIDGVGPLGGCLSNVPVEEIERTQPLRVEEYGFVEDTGGVGKWRGCLSIARQVRFLGEEAVLHIRSDRRANRACGFAGGGAGAASTTVLNPGTSDELLPTIVTRTIKRGDVVRHVTAGGGGHGLASERPRKFLARDVANGKVSAEVAEREYGWDGRDESAGAATT